MRQVFGACGVTYRPPSPEVARCGDYIPSGSSRCQATTAAASAPSGSVQALAAVASVSMENMGDVVGNSKGAVQVGASANLCPSSGSDVGSGVGSDVDSDVGSDVGSDGSVACSGSSEDGFLSLGRHSASYAPPPMAEADGGNNNSGSDSSGGESIKHISTASVSACEGGEGERGRVKGEAAGFIAV